MERLTFDGNFCDIAQCRELPCPHGGSCTQRKVWERLKAYEDTGLTAAEIERSKMEIEAGCVKAVARTYGININRLRQLAAADRSGRAVILPCELGTPVYITFCGEVWEMRVGQFHVNGYTKPRIWADIDCDWASTQCVRWDSAIGKTIFLTREEAEKALEEEKND